MNILNFKKENLGKAFLMVNARYNFGIKQEKVCHSDFGFTLVTQSEFFRGFMTKFCKECHCVQQKNFSPKIIKNARKLMREFVSKSIKTESDFLELVAIIFDVAYYTAVIQLVIIAFASITINIESIRIINTMFTSVKKRTREIGIISSNK